MLKLKVLRI